MHCCTSTTTVQHTKTSFRFLPEKPWVEISQSTGETKLVKECHEQEGFFYYELDKGYWVNLPEAIRRRERNEHDSRLLLDVLHQLMNFVTKTASKLLCSSLLLPQQEFFFESILQGAEWRPSSNQLQAYRRLR